MRSALFKCWRKGYLWIIFSFKIDVVKTKQICFIHLIPGKSMSSTKNLSPFTDRLKLYTPILTNCGLSRLRFEHLTFLSCKVNASTHLRHLSDLKFWFIHVAHCSMPFYCMQTFTFWYLLSFSRNILAVDMFSTNESKSFDPSYIYFLRQLFSCDNNIILTYEGVFLYSE